MRGAVLLAASLVSAFAAGCATTSVDVAFDPAQDFAQYRTWDWLPRGRNVSALPGEERTLKAAISRLVEQELEQRGLVRVRSGADLLVGYELRVRRQLVILNETGAEDLLASHHSSPSYQIQSTTRRIDVYDRGYLWVAMTDGDREGRVWRGELRARRRGRLLHHLPELIPRLLVTFPAGKTALGAAP